MRLENSNFLAWVSCEGKTLPMYDQDLDGNTTTCWIPSVAGTQFSVHWRCINPQDASSGHIFIDGNDVASAIIRPGAFTPVLRSGAKTKDGLRPFTFARLNLTDNEQLANPRDPTLMDIGSIELRLTYVRLGPPVKFEGYETKNRGLAHERAKKMGAHYTAYGKATALPKSRAVSTAPLDPGNPGPHVRFIFRYRSLEVLQAQGIVPLPPKKRPAEEEEDEGATQGTLVSSDPDDAGEPGGSEIHNREGAPRLPQKKRPRRLSSGSPENDENMASTAAPDDDVKTAGKMPLFMDDDGDAEGSKDVGRRPILSLPNGHDDQVIEDEPVPVIAPDIPGAHADDENENDDMKEEVVNPFVTNDDNLPEGDEDE